MENNNNSEWTLVQYKNKKNNNKSKKKLKKDNTNNKFINKNISNKNNILNYNDYIKLIRQRYSDDSLRPIEKKDYTLSKYEEQIVSNYQSEFCCYCCSSSCIENIIKRPFTSCGVCYCCVGDDPSFDMPELCIFVNDKLNKHFVFWDKKSPYKYYNN